jgi:hypothetical protein
MVYIVNKLEHETGKVVSVGFHNTSVWDAKGIAVRYIRLFILNEDGKSSLSTAFNLDTSELPVDKPVDRHTFVLNEEDGTLDVYYLYANMVNGWLSTYREPIQRKKVFSLSITSVHNTSFETCKFVPFESKDLTIKNNESSKEEEEVDVMKSLVSELKEFIIKQRQIATSKDDSDDSEDTSEDDSDVEILASQ